MNLNDVLQKMPLIAVLRGLKPSEASAIGQSLIQTGFLCLEVPMNSPDPLQSIQILADQFGDQALVGAGTVLEPNDVEKIKAHGGRLIISPHCDVEVIKAAKAQDMICIPGIATPTEAFSALKAGADAIKFFPAEAFPPKAIKAMRAVLPKDTLIIPTGGVTPDNMKDLMAHGANGFGLGSALYRPGDDAAAVAQKAQAFIGALS